MGNVICVLPYFCPSDPRVPKTSELLIKNEVFMSAVVNKIRSKNVQTGALATTNQTIRLKNSSIKCSRDVSIVQNAAVSTDVSIHLKSIAESADDIAASLTRKLKCILANQISDLKAQVANSADLAMRQRADRDITKLDNLLRTGITKDDVKQAIVNAVAAAEAKQSINLENINVEVYGECKNIAAQDISIALIAKNTVEDIGKMVDDKVNRALRTEPTPPVPESDPSPVPEPVPDPSRFRKYWLVWIAAIAAILLAVLAAFAML